ncbi:MAG: endospore germination permease [Clostridiaceae bacterium]|nr:endospore germination permease [Clostridiaceae bacterium]
MNKKIITNKQLFSLAAGGSIGGSVLVSAPLMAGIAKQDAWIGALIALIYGACYIFMLTCLSSQFPNMNFVEIIQTLLGKWLGSAFCVYYIFLCILLSAHIPWYVGDFLTTMVMPETPQYFVNAIYIIALAIGVSYGLEAFARASEIFLKAGSFLFILAMVLVLPNAHIGNLQPILENGILPPLKSSVVLSSFSTFTLIILLMIYPSNINEPKKASKEFVKGYIWGGFISFTSIFLSILVLGWNITSKSRYAAYILANEIEIGVIFARIEFIVFASWILTQFVVNVLYFYAGISSLAHLLKLKQSGKVILPLSLFLLALAEIIFPGNIYQENWIVFGWVPFIITLGLVLPLCLFIVYWIKRLVSGKQV